MVTVEIRVRGCIDDQWSDWFGDLAITHTEDETVLVGEITDQAALYGTLAKLRDLGLELLSVQRPATSPPSPIRMGEGGEGGG